MWQLSEDPGSFHLVALTLSILPERAALTWPMTGSWKTCSFLCRQSMLRALTYPVYHNFVSWMCPDTGDAGSVPVSWASVIFSLGWSLWADSATVVLTLQTGGVANGCGGLGSGTPSLDVQVGMATHIQHWTRGAKGKGELGLGHWGLHSSPETLVWRGGPVQPKSSSVKSFLVHCFSLLPPHHGPAYYQGLQSNHPNNEWKWKWAEHRASGRKARVRPMETTHNFKMK